MSEELNGLAKALAEVEEAEKNELGVEVETPEPKEEVEAPQEEAKEAPKEEPKPEPAKVEEEKPDASVFYKLRQAAKKREELERELAELKQPKPTIPDANDDIEGHLTAKVAQLEGTLNNVLGVVGQDLLAKKEEQELESAFSVLGQFEKRLESEKPDYQQARNHIARIYAEEYKLKNPNMTEKQLVQAVAKEIINVADYAAANGKDPASFIYERASLYGYRQELKQEAKQEPVKKQPDLSKIAANKEKSAGMASGAGSGAAHGLTFEALENMSTEERMKLSDSDWARV
jgi:hypothetical protein